MRSISITARRSLATAAVAAVAATGGLIYSGVQSANAATAPAARRAPASDQPAVRRPAAPAAPDNGDITACMIRNGVPEFGAVVRQVESARTPAELRAAA